MLIWGTNRLVLSVGATRLLLSVVANRLVLSVGDSRLQLSVGAKRLWDLSSRFLMEGRNQFAHKVQCIESSLRCCEFVS